MHKVTNKSKFRKMLLNPRNKFRTCNQTGEFSFSCDCILRENERRFMFWYMPLDEFLKKYGGDWLNVRVELKWSDFESGDDGFLKVWFNGDQIVDYVGAIGRN